jgi:hypothetical protein
MNVPNFAETRGVQTQPDDSDHYVRATFDLFAARHFSWRGMRHFSLDSSKFQMCLETFHCVEVGDDRLIPLLQVGPQLDGIAIAVNHILREIMTSDVPALLILPSDEVLVNILRVVQVGIESEVMRDEIYCQLVVWTFHRIGGLKGEASLARVYKVMLLCLACFPPSRRLSPALYQHLSRAQLRSAGFPHSRLPLFVALCREKVPRISSLGAREGLPSLQECRDLWCDSPILVRVEYLGGEAFAAVDAWTTISDIRSQVSRG